VSRSLPLATIELSLRLRRTQRGRPRILRQPSGVVGLTGAVLVLVVGLLGSFVAPHNPNDTLTLPFASPSPSFPLGADFLGRDVLSRVLAGGRSMILLSVSATLLAYAIGLTAGMVAGYTRSALLDSLLMRSADVLLAFPPLIFLLVVTTGTDQSLAALVVSIGIIQAPGLARIIRSAVLDVGTRGYVEAALVRGETTAAVIRREILPNISNVIAADFGLRLSYSVLLFVSVSFLGLGVQPPQADWARMISENRIALTTTPLPSITPALLVAALTVSVNLIADAVARTSGTSIEKVAGRTGKQ
jgi:peptide/nickel transport system permease protein